MSGPTIPTGDVRDFDFLAGTWSVANRRLKTRWVGSAEWDEFPGTCHCALHMGGVVNVDEIAFPTKGFSGMTMRLFDRARRRWSIYWTNSDGAVLFPPVHGGFSGDRGAFFGEDVDDGRPVRVRYVWTRRGSGGARWEQAFSLDGQAWEWNWSMDFSRVTR